MTDSTMTDSTMMDYIETPEFKTSLQEIAKNVGFCGFSKTVINMNPGIYIDHSTMDVLWNRTILKFREDASASLVLNARSQARSAAANNFFEAHESEHSAEIIAQAAEQAPEQEKWEQELKKELGTLANQNLVQTNFTWDLSTIEHLSGAPPLAESVTPWLSGIETN
ncbi:MAG: hypothetical protein M1812_005820 [Candelaria pacifica]|nr:MAG: hypothetical protein M1812_005820 [Candelaria pacifica]